MIYNKTPSNSDGVLFEAGGWRLAVGNQYLAAGYETCSWQLVAGNGLSGDNIISLTGNRKYIS